MGKIEKINGQKHSLEPTIVEQMPDTDSSILVKIQETMKARANGNCDNSLPQVSVPIPDSVLIECPKALPNIRQAKYCEGCGCFNGIVQKSYSDTCALPWSHKYAVRCGFALERVTRQMVIG